MSTLTLRHLRYLEALARQRHFGKAAEECAVSQPALSMQIHELEELLGAQLVERRHGVTTLTEIGTEVALRATHILGATRDLFDFVRHSGSILTGTLRLGLIPTLAPYVLPRLLPELHHRYPELRLEMRETQTRMLLAELTSGALDAAMLALPIDEAEVETVQLFNDPFLLAVPASDPMPERARVTTRDVAKRTLLLLEEGHCLRDQALAFCATARRDPATGLGATSLGTVMQMVANSYGVTLVPEVAIDVEIRDERVKLLRFVDPQPSRTIGLAWRRTSPRRADFFALGQTVVEALNVPPQQRAMKTEKGGTAPARRRARRANHPAAAP